jgi:SPP1 gp7 family putative phage head morphogenesis protein
LNFAFDDARFGKRKEKAYFAKVRRAEFQYARKLRQIARQIGQLTGAFDPLDLTSMQACQEALSGYSTIISAWARSAASAMLSDLMKRDEKAWAALSSDISRNLRLEIQSAPIGQVLRQYLDEQVVLITSLPRDAAERVQKLAREAHTETGARQRELAQEIMRTGEVTISRANLIARTEIARVSSGLTMARAQHIGSEGYIWRTSADTDVRSSHRALNGTFHRWDDPPECDPGHHAHPGMIWNCRCWPEPILPDVIA